MVSINHQLMPQEVLHEVRPCLMLAGLPGCLPILYTFYFMTAGLEPGQHADVLGQAAVASI